jgi:hypothetical protein
MSRKRRRSKEYEIDAAMAREENLQLSGERDREVLLANFENVLRDKRVRALVWEILSMTGIAHVNTRCDETVFFTEGRRDIGREILLLLDEIDVKLYPTMMLESASKENDDE